MRILSTYFGKRFSLIFYIISFAASANVNTLDDSPLVSAIEPSDGKIGDYITLTGTGLEEFSDVIFSNVATGEVIQSKSIFRSDTKFVFTVPSNIRSGLVTVAGAFITQETNLNFTYKKSKQSIVGINSGEYIYGQPPIIIEQQGAGNPLQLSVVSNPVNGVLSVVGNTIRVIGVGTATVTSFRDGDNNFDAELTKAVITITKAELRVNIANNTKAFGSLNPIFSGTVTGFKFNDANTISTTYFSNANQSASAGQYQITASFSGAALRNYSIVSTPGTLTITKASQTINIPEIPNYELGSATGFLTILNITATSGLPVDVQVKGNGSVAFFEQGVAILRIVDKGTITITGDQLGNINYEPAPTVTKQVEITSKLTSTIDFDNEIVQVFPNPSNGLLNIKSPPNSELKITDAMGVVLANFTLNSEIEQVLILKKGLHFVEIKNNRRSKTLKIEIE